MAQLSDDCFAFGGPLLAIDEVERLINERVTPVAETETVALKDARGPRARRRLIAPIDLPPFDNSAVDGYAVRHADLGKDETTLTIGRPPDRRPCGGARDWPGASDPHLHRRADAGRRRHGVHARGRAGRCRFGDRAAGVEARRQPKARRRGRARRLGRAACGPPAAAAGSAHGGRARAAASAVRRRVRVAIFSTGDEIVEPGAPLPRPASTTPTATAARLLARLGAEVSDLGILRDDPAKLRARLAEAAHGTISCSPRAASRPAKPTTCAARRSSRLAGVLARRDQAGRPVAMGVLRGTAFVGLPGNPVAVFVTFARVVRPLLLRLAGAQPEPLIALPVVSGFAYRKKKGRREYVRVSLTRRDDGLRSHKHPQDGAGRDLLAHRNRWARRDSPMTCAPRSTPGQRDRIPSPYSVLAG
jgi:molybdopterin molybdotransferase